MVQKLILPATNSTAESLGVKAHVLQHGGKFVETGNLRQKPLQNKEVCRPGQDFSFDDGASWAVVSLQVGSPQVEIGMLAFP